MFHAGAALVNSSLVVVLRISACQIMLAGVNDILSQHLYKLIANRSSLKHYLLAWMHRPFLQRFKLPDEM